MKKKDKDKANLVKLTLSSPEGKEREVLANIAKVDKGITDLMHIAPVRESDDWDSMVQARFKLVEVSNHIIKTYRHIETAEQER